MSRSASGHAGKLIFRTAAALAIVLAFAAAIHPYGVLKKPRVLRDNLQAAVADARAAAIVNRSCANCHSDNTSWPWYSYVPPASWLVEKDVAEARSHFNLSGWASYNSEKKAELLADIARVVANREMPLPPYLLLHKEARLSDADVQALVGWAGRERRTLRAQTSGP